MVIDGFEFNENVYRHGAAIFKVLLNARNPLALKDITISSGAPQTAVTNFLAYLDGADMIDIHPLSGVPIPSRKYMLK